MRYRKNYILSHSIDWFAKIGNSWAHCASLGGLIPDSADDVTNLRQFQALINLVPDYTDRCEINEAFIEQRYQRHLRMVRQYNERIQQNVLNGNADESHLIEESSLEEFQADYVALFESYARKGMHSFARYDIDEIENAATALVAKPTNEAAEQLNSFLTGILNQTADIEFSGIESFRRYIDKITIATPAPLLDFTTDLSRLIR